MSERRLSYSERKRLSETGSLGDLVGDTTPRALILAMLHFHDQAANKRSVGRRYMAAVRDASIALYGTDILAPTNVYRQSSLQDPDKFLNLCEIVIAEGAISRTYTDPAGYGRSAKAWPDAEAQLNDLFDTHRFGFEIVEGQAQPISSPRLSEEVVGPALLAAKREGWGEVERSFREAIQHQRAGPEENDDALTAANAAIEAALKACGFKGSHLGPLAADFKNSDYAHPQLKEVPEALHSLLGRDSALRNVYSDSHGKHEGAEAVPDRLVNLSIHLAGAFIVYLAEQQAAG